MTTGAVGFFYTDLDAVNIAKDLRDARTPALRFAMSSALRPYLAAEWRQLSRPLLDAKCSYL